MRGARWARLNAPHIPLRGVLVVIDTRIETEPLKSCVTPMPMAQLSAQTAYTNGTIQKVVIVPTERRRTQRDTALLPAFRRMTSLRSFINAGQGVLSCWKQSGSWLRTRKQWVAGEGASEQGDWYRFRLGEPHQRNPLTLFPAPACPSTPTPAVNHE